MTHLESTLVTLTSTGALAALLLLTAGYLLAMRTHHAATIRLGVALTLAGAGATAATFLGLLAQAVLAIARILP